MENHIYARENGLWQTETLLCEHDQIRHREILSMEKLYTVEYSNTEMYTSQIIEKR